MYRVFEIVNWFHSFDNRSSIFGIIKKAIHRQQMYRFQIQRRRFPRWKHRLLFVQHQAHQHIHFTQLRLMEVIRQRLSKFDHIKRQIMTEKIFFSLSRSFSTFSNLYKFTQSASILVRSFYVAKISKKQTFLIHDWIQIKWWKLYW